MKHSKSIIIFILAATLRMTSLAILPPQAHAEFDRLAASVEARVVSAQPLVADGATRARLRQGEILIINEAPQQPRGAMLHHWRAMAFAPGAKTEDFLAVMQSFEQWPSVYSPQVIAAHLIHHKGDNFQISMRVRERHVLTVVLDADYAIRFGRVDATRGYSISRSTRTAEIAHAGERSERTLTSEEEMGYLARSNTYWRYEEAPDGLYIECESLTLTRDAPSGLKWAVRPFVQSIPQQALRFTVESTRKALQSRRIHGR